MFHSMTSKREGGRPLLVQGRLGGRLGVADGFSLLILGEVS
jgi:hypothetical protein